MGVIELYKKRSIWCLAGVLAVFCFHCFVSRQITFIRHSTGSIAITDYAYHIILVKAFWFEGFGNIYEIFFHQKVLSMHIGTKIHYVMPLGITPIALIIWLPFAFVARFSMALSYTLWITFSVSVLFFALWSVGLNVLPNKNLRILPITLFLVTLFSWNTLSSIYLGQTSVLAAGLLIHLIYIVHNTVNKSQPSHWLLIALLIFILGIKPPYIALGLGLLMIYGLWREAFYSTILVLVVLIGITPILGVEWVSSYLKTLRTYAQGNIPDIYSWSIAFETMNIFRSAFRNVIGDNLTGLISTFVTCCVYIGVVGYSIFTKIRKNTTEQFSPIQITKEQLFILLVASYLLFAPYAGAYEDLLFLPVFVMVFQRGNTPPLTNYKSIALTLFLFAILSHNIFSLDKPLGLFWILKFTTLSFMLHFCRFSSEENNFLTP